MVWIGEERRANTNSERVEIPVEFPFPLHRKEVGALVVELVKYILHQCNQIPQQYNHLIQEVKASNEVDKEPGNDTIDAQVNTRREILKQNRENQRKKRFHQKYIKKASTFLTSCDEMLTALKSAIEEEEGENILSIRFVIGSTPLSAKAIFRVQLPTNWADDVRANFRPGPHLFRAMVTNEDLFRATSRKMPAKNMFVYLEKRDINSSEHVFVPVLAPQDNPRANSIHILLNTPSVMTEPDPPPSTGSSNGVDRLAGRVETLKVAAVIERPSITRSSKQRRLRFHSESIFVTPGPKQYHGEPVGFDRFSPVPMELCTPGGLLQPPLTVDTPCNPSVKPRKRHFSMDMCTPMRKNNPLDEVEDFCFNCEKILSEVKDDLHVNYNGSASNNDDQQNISATEETITCELNTPFPKSDNLVTNPTDSAEQTFWLMWRSPIKGFSQIGI